MNRERLAEREREWRRFIEAERAALENRRRGQLAKLLGETLPGESREELDRLAQEDRSRAEVGLVELRDGDEVYYKHVDDLTLEDLRARAKAEEAQKAWLTGRLRKLTGDLSRHTNISSPRHSQETRASEAPPERVRGSTRPDAAELLTARQMEILSLVARGMSNRRIAENLYITEKTVKRHLVNIFARMEVRTRGEATREALRRGWIPVGTSSRRKRKQGAEEQPLRDKGRENVHVERRKRFMVVISDRLPGGA